MKTKLLILSLAAGAVVATAVMTNRAEAATAPSSNVETPIGRLVDVQLVAWPLSTGTVGRINGTLIAMQPGWLIVKEGSYEHWIPSEKVMAMRVTR